MRSTAGPSLQERYAPHNRCFGCGTGNERGLGLRSFVAPDGASLVAEFFPEPHHAGFGEVLHGGVIAALFDCHANWSAAHRKMRDARLDSPPPTVTAELHVTYLRPTSLLTAVMLDARAVAVDGRRIVVEASLESAGAVTARCRGTFVCVEERHPGFAAG